MNASAIITGSELIHGQVSDQNGIFFAKKLSGTNIELRAIYIVRDDIDEIPKILESAISRSNIIFITGGLGPTDDDVTCQAICNVCNRDAVIDESSKARMEKFFSSKGLSFSDSDLKMVTVPVGAHVFPNEKGLACGFAIEESGCLIIALPGVPHEMEHMFEKFVWPFLLKRLNIIERKTIVMKIAFYREAEVNSKIRSIGFNNDVEWGICARYGICEVTFFEKKGTPFPYNFIHESMKKIFGDSLLVEESLEKEVLLLLIKKRLTLACAESCTGGLISSKITDIPGASKVFLGTVVAYSNEAKMHLLGVSERTLQSFGAVSEETAGEMAQGACKALGADVAISITGIAGPEGGSIDKPVGTVCFGLATPNALKTKKEFFSGDRERIRNYSAMYALNFVRLFLLKL